MKIQHTKLTATGIAVTQACDFRGLLIGTDSTNNPTISFYDSQDTSGNEPIPTATYDASVQGLYGVTLPGDGIRCEYGLYVEITCAGTLEVVIFWT